MSIQDFQVGTAVAVAYGEGGFLGVQPDGFGDNPGTNARHSLGIYGVISRPLDADENGVGALCLWGDEGAEGFAWMGFDPRDVSRVPPASGGSSGIYNSRGSFILLDHATNTSTWFVPIEFDASGNATKSHGIQVGYDANDKACINLTHADGMSVSLIANGVVIKNAAGDAYVEVGANGIVLNGNVKLVGGLDVGGGAALPVTLAPALIQYLSALEGILGALAATIDAKLAPTATTATAVSEFVSHVAALKVAMTATLTKGL